MSRFKFRTHIELRYIAFRQMEEILDVARVKIGPHV